MLCACVCFCFCPCFPHNTTTYRLSLLHVCRFFQQTKNRQNIDGLETVAGVSEKKMVYAHGSLRWAKCMRCSKRVMSDEIMSAIERGSVPRCQVLRKKNQRSTSTASSNNGSVSNNSSSPGSSRGDSPAPREPSQRTRKRARATSSLFSLNEDDEPTDKLNDDFDPSGMYCGGVLKPAVTFFGETLSDNVRRKIESDRKKVDALIVIGTSLSVAPISKVISYLPCNIPRILINRTIVHPAITQTTYDSDDDDENNAEQYKDFRDDYVFDAYLLGYCDDVTRALARKLFRGSANKNGEKEETPKGGSQDNKKKRRTVPSNAESTENPRSLQNQYGAGLLTSVLDGNEDDWKQEEWSSCIDVPKERVLLFPGALASKDDTTSEMDYREIANCDGCSKRIHGIIKKCVNCFDYDLCSLCFPKLSKTHFDGTHSFSSENAAP